MPSTAAAGTAMGSMMAKVPQDVPVENATTEVTRKRTAGTSHAGMAASATPAR